MGIRSITLALFVLFLSFSSIGSAVTLGVEPAVLLSKDKCGHFHKIKMTKDKNFIVLASCYVGSSSERRIYKISASGAKLWRNFYKLPTFTITDMALDAEDNIFVSGSEQLSQSSVYPYSVRSGIVVKVSSAGAYQWSYRQAPEGNSQLQFNNIVFTSIATQGNDAMIAAYRYEHEYPTTVDGISYDTIARS